MDRREYTVIVIGGGHAGAEAAWAAANLLPAGTDGPGSVALVTLDPGTIGVMPCNPAIGGLAKGQLVREIDALGGLMGLAADATGIMFKVLNTSRGSAVHGPRCQCDKHAYARAVQTLLASRAEIDVIAGTVERLIVERGRIRGVVLGPPRGGAGCKTAIHAPAVVLTTGTFMRGLMHTGLRKTPGGRHGESASSGISAQLSEMGLELGRLKTGTPPRLERGTIDWDALDEQRGDAAPVAFSDLTPEGDRSGGEDERGDGSSGGGWRVGDLVAERFPVLEQVSCRATCTTPEIHDLIRANLHRAPIYSGQIESAGPRYCPSIEDKVVRFADRDSHTVFLEPESLDDGWVYCNGISTSLPGDVQDQIVRAMPGCERARILRYGYAVEYDIVRPHQIHPTGRVKRIAGLYLAGQINGTSGYEEAAGQGVVAGINAARDALGQGRFVLGRDEAYIGVMMDDLVTRTPVEPYRMFTSRAEHRLLLRADNAADRLTPLAIDLGLLGASALGRQRVALFERRRWTLRRLNRLIDATRVEGQPLDRALRRPEFTVTDLKSALDVGPLPESIWRTLHSDRRYEAYITRQKAEIRRQREMEGRGLPEGINYLAMKGLRYEAAEALDRFRPGTFGQAGRLEGVTPADLTLLSVLVRRLTRATTTADALVETAL